MPRKVFVAGEILTAADVNTNLMDQAVMVFDDAAARTAAIPSPTEGMVTYLKDTDAVEVFTTAFGPFGGKILQVVEGTTSTSTSTTSVAFQSTNLTGSITPSSTSSKILVIATSNFLHASTAASCIATIFRGTTADTNLGAGSAGGAEIYNGGSSLTANQTISVLDSPNTTSSQTYTLAFRVSNTSGMTVTAQIGGTRASIILMEVAG